MKVKPQTEDGINYQLVGCKLQILSIEDIIPEDAFIRDCYEDAHVDAGWDTTYKTDEWRGSQWHPVKVDFSGWIGKSYRDYMNAAKVPDNFIMHEIAVIL